MNTGLIDYNNLLGTVFDIGNKVCVIVGFNYLGAIVQVVEEVDPIHSQQCKYCKAIDYLKSCYKKPEGQQVETKITKESMKLIMYSTVDGKSVIEIVNPSLEAEEARKLGIYLKELNRELTVPSNHQTTT